jgi:hypothetical protein
MSTTMKTSLRIAALAALAIVTTAVTSRTARAETANKCTKVNVVEYYQDTLLIQCAETTGLVNYLAQVHPADTSSTVSCKGFASNLDSIKIWMSLAQTALLAGKPLLIYNTICGPDGGQRLIRVVDLDR